MSENDDFDKTHIRPAPSSTPHPGPSGPQGPQQQYGQPSQQPPITPGAQQHPAPYPQQPNPQPYGQPNPSQYGRPQPQQYNPQQYGQPNPQQYSQPNPYPGAPFTAPNASGNFTRWLKQDKASLLFCGALVLIGIMLFFVPLFTWLSVRARKGRTTLNGLDHLSFSPSPMYHMSGDKAEELAALNSVMPAFTSPIHTMLGWTGIILIAAGLITALTTSKLGDVIAAVSSGCMALALVIPVASTVHSLKKLAAMSGDAYASVSIGSGVIIGMVLLVAALAIAITHLVRPPAPSRRMFTDHL